MRVKLALVKDALLGRLPPEYLGWLLRHYGLSRRRLYLSLCVTTDCNRHCRECIQRNLLGGSRPQHMPLDEVEHLLRVSEASRYEFNFVVSGGEPLLWPDLKEGVRLLRASRVCGSIRMFTNAMDIGALDDETAGRLDTIRISKYPENHGNVETLLRRYPRKVKVIEREYFWPNPAEAVAGTLPPRCCTPQPWLSNRRVYFCPHCASIAKGHGHEGVPSNPLAVGFLKGLHRIARRQHRHVCGYCFHNRKVQEQLTPAPNARGAARP